MSCMHLDQVKSIRPPTVQSVHHEVCALCFDGQDSPTGVDVCRCLDSTRQHAKLHFDKTHHGFTLNVRRKLKPNAQRVEDEEPPAKMKKLAIAEEREEDKYEHILTLKCWLCDSSTGGKPIPDALQDPKIKALTDGTMTSLSSSRQSEVKAWEEEIVPCGRALLLQKKTSEPIPASAMRDLWFSQLRGRPLHGGFGGKDHGLAHFNEPKHPVNVKLGTITPEGNYYYYPPKDARPGADFADFASKMPCGNKAY
ncbi:hypothetical protein P691DRAFT_784835 [Macrolepiota fuliginosa MF-IS2]|uniref:Ubiquitinyl hydrolase variant UBP zinc finger domain-containing protein n=1 Tax=Macrolepiota fuliginosa MF-IS2 TaxID=1400762 RepID=A0A9P5X754_9AGAR|nr:hypothetical protein P691DRAFT_784835 [Macrolepiota fuliginosa MF-IS2]